MVSFLLDTKVSPANTGSIFPIAGTYLSGLIEISATGSGAYRLQNWTGALTGSTNPTNLLLDGNKVVSGNFYVPTELNKVFVKLQII